MKMQPMETIDKVENWDFAGMVPRQLLAAVQMDTENDDIKCVQFDIAEALYHFCADYHGGQWSELYSVLSELGEIYSPGMGDMGPEEGTAAWEIYAELEAMETAKADGG